MSENQVPPFVIRTVLYLHSVSLVMALYVERKLMLNGSFIV